MSTTARPLPDRRPLLRRVLRRVMYSVGGVLFLLVAFGVAVHIKAFRPFFARLGIGCPAWGVSANQVMATRERGIGSLRGSTVARERPALGLSLDRTTEQDALAFARAAGLSCEEKTLGLQLVECVGHAPSIFGVDDGGRDVLSLSFDPRGVLITVDVLRRGLDGAHAERVLADATSVLEERVGPPSEESGARTDAFLSAAPMRTAVARWRYSDYLAFVTASHLPSGICIHEIYQSALAPTSS